MSQVRWAERRECGQPKRRGQRAALWRALPVLVLCVQHSWEGNGLSTEMKRMEKVTCSEGFLKPLISCGGNSSTKGSARGLGRGDWALGSELREPQGGRLTQRAIMAGLPC